MTMAHDPTRHWPLGVGPENTRIPGAAWLELRDGQTFPVVGAGAMVWNGAVWVPVSAQNRLPVEATLLSRLEGKLDTAIFDSQGNPISANNRLPVDIGGQIHADVDLGDVTVDIGVVKQGGKDASA